MIVVYFYKVEDFFKNSTTLANIPHYQLLNPPTAHRNVVWNILYKDPQYCQQILLTTIRSNNAYNPHITR